MTLRDPLCAIKADKPIVINRPRKRERGAALAGLFETLFNHGAFLRY